MFIGLLGGSFNPIHNGHLHIARHISRILQLDQVLFIPTGDPPHKDTASLASAFHRLAMVKLAINPYPHFAVYEREIHFPGISYTFDTLSQLIQEYPAETRFGFLIGLDAFLEIQSWKMSNQLFHLCQFIVSSRPGVSFTQLGRLPFFPAHDIARLERLDAGTVTRVEVELPDQQSLILLSVPPCEVSASAIRRNIARKEPVQDWLPAQVESYILQHHLYQCPQ
ncbi:MAG: nicotinate-nucleotide adenylyltransferase [Nitrospirales bacterium]